MFKSEKPFAFQVHYHTEGEIFKALPQFRSICHRKHQRGQYLQPHKRTLSLPDIIWSLHTWMYKRNRAHIIHTRCGADFFSRGQTSPVEREHDIIVVWYVCDAAGHTRSLPQSVAWRACAAALSRVSECALAWGETFRSDTGTGGPTVITCVTRALCNFAGLCMCARASEKEEREREREEKEGDWSVSCGRLEDTRWTRFRGERETVSVDRSGGTSPLQIVSFHFSPRPRRNTRGELKSFVASFSSPMILFVSVRVSFFQSVYVALFLGGLGGVSGSKRFILSWCWKFK